MEVVRNYLNYLKEKELLNQYTTIVNMDETPTGVPKDIFNIYWIFKMNKIDYCKFL
jgi:hypothetical protein